VELGQFDLLMTSFGEDESGELYVLNQSSASGVGELYRLRFASPGGVEIGLE
jgi:hypothetical protein